MQRKILKLGSDIINALAEDEIEAQEARQEAKELEYRQYGARVFENWRTHVKDSPRKASNRKVPTTNFTKILIIDFVEPERGGTTDVPEGLLACRFKDVPKMVKTEGVDFSTMVDKMRKEFHCDDNNNRVVHQPEVLRLQTKDALISLLHKVGLW